jgi:NAD(P)-dependent dehydrogenase (short-subunit alcohol dehydrogenase family)
MSSRTILIVGGTSGIGLELAKDVIARGDQVVITGRDDENCRAVAEGLGPQASSIALDISEPEAIAGQLAGLGRIHGLVLAAIERDANTIREYDIAKARRLVTLKLVGYAETVHTLLDRLEPSRETGIVLFGGRAKDAPYPGSTTVSTINGGVEGLTRTLALELAPIRVNAIHPGIIGDSPFWAGKPEGVLDQYTGRTPGGELATMADIVDATQFLLRNQGISGENIHVDRGWRLV